MSMLAERKRKQKLQLDPRGKWWSEDTNKFGQRMLEKMGWSAGKGLGAKEDGIKEQIKVKFKSDATGVGFTPNDDVLSEHENNFSGLLQNLSGLTETHVRVNSLERKSQQSRARVHYHKFTRGKDLSRYSEKDFKCIFGKKDKKEVEKEEEAVADVKSFGVQTVTSGNMVDYFKNKLGLLKFDGSGEGEERRGFGFNGSSDVATEDGKVGKKSCENFVSYLNASDGEFTNTGIDIENNTKTKKSKKRKSTDENESTGDSFVDTTKSKKDKSTHKENEIDNSKAKSKKRKSVEASENVDTPQKKKKMYLEGSLEDCTSTDDPPKLKKKKSKHKENGIDNPALNITMEDSVTENTIDLPKERKKKKQKTSGIENPGLNISMDDPEGESGGKKKRRKSEVNGFDNPGLDSSLENSEDPPLEACNDFEVPRKKKKSKRKELTFDNPALDPIETIDEGKNVPKKKRKNTVAPESVKSEDLYGLDNPGLDSTLDTTTEEATESVRFNPELSSVSGIINPGLNISDDVSTPKSKNNSTYLTPILQKTSIETPGTDKQKKKVTFSGFTSEKIVEKTEEVTTDIMLNVVSEKVEANISKVSEKIDVYQTELENDMNEKKLRKRNTMYRIRTNNIRVKFVGSNLDKLPGYGIRFGIKKNSFS